MGNIIAKIGFIGDTHLCSGPYGAHKDYPKESLEYFHKVTELTESLGLTHLIGTGDLTFRKFGNLEYREKVEAELVKQNELTHGNRFEVKGNHDSATNGMTEYEYYVRRGLLKPSTNFSIGNVNITMLDYKKDGKYTSEEFNIKLDESVVNVVVAHQYFKFKNTQLPNYGDAILLDNYNEFLRCDYLLCGHVHKIMHFDGIVTSGENSSKCDVQYLGCMMRPAYREGHMDNVGIITVITVEDDGQIKFETVEIPLWSLEESFNLAEKALQKEKKEEKDNRVDITDIVKQLDTHERNVGNPEDIIQAMEGIDSRYKDKAIELLHNA